MVQYVMQWHPPVDTEAVLSTAALCKEDTMIMLHTVVSYKKYAYEHAKDPVIPSMLH